MRVSSNSYKYHTTNNFERLIEKEGMKITSIITTLILTTIGIHIGPTGFLQAGAPEVVFDTNRRILEGLVIIEKICAKLIFGRCVGLDWGDYHKLEAAHTANHEYNMIEAEKGDSKAKTKRLKNEKQQQKHIEEKEKICQ